MPVDVAIESKVFGFAILIPEQPIQRRNCVSYLRRAEFYARGSARIRARRRPEEGEWVWMESIEGESTYL